MENFAAMKKTIKKHLAKMQFQLCIMHKSNFLCVHQHRREFKISFPLFIVESFFYSSAKPTKTFLHYKRSRKKLSKTGCLAPFQKNENLALNLHKFVLFMFVLPFRWHNKFHLHLEKISPPFFSHWHFEHWVPTPSRFLIKKTVC